MPDDERRYRRLLRAYPRWHRRLHGADMLTTLLDAAAEGRRGGGALGVVLDGLRTRLRVRGAGARALAGMLAVLGAGTVAALAGLIGWYASVAPWPSTAQAAAQAAAVAPAGTPESVTDRHDPLGPWLSDADSVLLTLLGSPELRPGGVYFSYTEPAAPDRAVAYRTAADRLSASGWRVAMEHGQLVADRNGLRLTLLYAGRDSATDDVVVAVYPTPPPVSWHLAGPGAVVGAVVGWLVAAAAIARTRRMTVERRMSIGMLAVLGGLAGLPASVLNLAVTAAGGLPPWAGYDVVLARPGAVVGGIALAGAVLLSARPTGSTEMAVSRSC